MKATAESLEFKPPQAGRWTGPVGLALVVHGLLIAALTWGIQWRDDPVLVAFETEIWSPTARQADPAPVQPPPPPEPETPPAPKPEPKPVPQPAPPAPPKVKDAEIATAQAKKKQEEERQRREALAQEKQRAKAEADKREKAEKAAREKKLAEDKKKKEAEQKKLAEQKREADEQRRADKAAQAAREEQLRRIMGQAGATGGATATGTAQRSSGPSSGYAGRVVARIRPNIIYQQEFPASLRAEVEVRAASDGTITARRVVRSSGDPEWDQAALRAIDRTGVLPRDVDGSVPAVITIVMRPRD